MITPRLYLKTEKQVYQRIPIQCGQTRTLVLNRDTGEWIPVIWYCRQPTCRLCSKIKSRRHKRRVLTYIGDLPVDHLVLTVARFHRPLGDAVDELFQSFKILKRRACWRRHVLGGVRFFDCAFKNDEDGGIWGPHFHLLVETVNFSETRLQEAWQQITKRSWVVDKSEIPDEIEELTAAVTYVAKPPYFSFADNDEAMVEYRRAMKGKRLGAVIGGWYKKLTLSGQRVVPQVNS